MSAVLTVTRPLPIVDLADTLPSHVREAIERCVSTLEGHPTKATIEEICQDSAICFHAEDVLRYFRMESDLDLFELRPLTATMAPQRAVKICQNTRQDRDNRERRDWRPRWSRTT